MATKEFLNILPDPLFILLSDPPIVGRFHINNLSEKRDSEGFWTLKEMRDCNNTKIGGHGKHMNIKFRHMMILKTKYAKGGLILALPDKSTFMRFIKKATGKNIEELEKRINDLGEIIEDKDSEIDNQTDKIHSLELQLDFYRNKFGEISIENGIETQSNPQ